MRAEPRGRVIRARLTGNCRGRRNRRRAKTETICDFQADSLGGVSQSGRWGRGDAEADRLLPPYGGRRTSAERVANPALVVDGHHLLLAGQEREVRRRLRHCHPARQ